MIHQYCSSIKDLIITWKVNLKKNCNEWHNISMKHPSENRGRITCQEQISVKTSSRQRP